MTRDEAIKRAAELNDAREYASCVAYGASRYHDKTDVWAVFAKYGYEPVEMVEV